MGGPDSRGNVFAHVADLLSVLFDTTMSMIVLYKGPRLWVFCLVSASELLCLPIVRYLEGTGRMCSGWGSRCGEPSVGLV